MKTQMYLTPSQAEELRELGVEFKGLETSCSWLLDSVGTWTIENTETAQWYHATPDSIYEKIICAPSLQEVMEKLPKFISIDGRKFWLVIAFTNKNEWSIGYEHMQHQQQNQYFVIGLKHCHNSNPLLAAFELLKWVAKNHPESLTDKTEQT